MAHRRATIWLVILASCIAASLLTLSEACLPAPGGAAERYELAQIIKSVLSADPAVTVTIVPAAATTTAVAPTTAAAAPKAAATAYAPAYELRIECATCSDAKARALARLVALAAPDLWGAAAAAAPPQGGGAPMAAAAMAVPAPPTAAAARIEALVTRRGVRVAPAPALAPGPAGAAAVPQEAAALVADALTGNTLFVKTDVRQGPVTSCEAPEGAFAYFAAAAVRPACPRELHPETAPGAAPCAWFAAAAFDRAFGLQRRLGLYTVTVAA